MCCIAASSAVCALYAREVYLLEVPLLSERFFFFFPSSPSSKILRDPEASDSRAPKVDLFSNLDCSSCTQKKRSWPRQVPAPSSPPKFLDGQRPPRLVKCTLALRSSLLLLLQLLHLHLHLHIHLAPSARASRATPLPIPPAAASVLVSTALQLLALLELRQPLLLPQQPLLRPRRRAAINLRASLRSA